MPLTIAAINAAKPNAKPYKLFDEKGLFLLVEPSGGRLWRLKYRYDGKEKKLAFGSYPETGLKDARDKRDEARKLLGGGNRPQRPAENGEAGQGCAGSELVPGHCRRIY